MQSDWLDVPSKQFGGCTEKVCPRCGCKSYYDQRPQVAWCWASGKIDIGDSMPEPGTDGGGAIKVASGPKSELNLALGVMARHAFERGVLLVPGVPEAPDQAAAGDALAEWLKWCQKGGKRTASRWPGVVWAAEVEATS
jgi:hypothetical protein